MENTEIKKLIKCYYEEVYNKGNIDALDRYLDVNIIDYSSPNGPVRGITAFKKFLLSLKTAFPDHRIDVNEILVENDKISVRLCEKGTHKGMLWGVPPTGKKVAISVFAIYRLEDNKIVEVWSLSDQAELMRQLGLSS